MDVLWRIDVLAGWVEKALALENYAGQDSARVREVPDVRTIRYYTTLGLLDRPTEMRGRTAFYSRRHLLQLVAIKRLQAAGKSLVEIQQALTGIGSARLQTLANLPAGFAETETPLAEAEPSPTPAPIRANFWATEPQQRETIVPPLAPAPVPVVALRLDERTSLLLEGVTPEQLNGEVLAALQPGLQMLREALDHVLSSPSNTEQQEPPI